MWKWELSEAVGEITVFDGWVGLCWGGYNQAIRGEVNVPNTIVLVRTTVIVLVITVAFWYIR